MAAPNVLDAAQLARFARLAELAYERNREALSAGLDRLGYELVELFDNSATDTQAYLARRIADGRLYLGFRGTEPDRLRDILTDGDIRLVAIPGWKTIFVHQGFWRAWLSVAAPIGRTLGAQERAFDTGGHSLGGALANVAAHELVPGGYLITYGAPRVGNAAFALAVDSRASHVRITRRADPVPLVPPAAMGFKHGGVKIYIDADGVLRPSPSIVCEAAMRAASALADGNPLETVLADHPIAAYADDIERAAARG